VTLNDVIAHPLRYFTEFGSFRGAYGGWRYTDTLCGGNLAQRM